MSNNAVVSLPDGILDLDKLEELNLAGNKLKDLPKVRCGNAEQGPGGGGGGGGANPRRLWGSAFPFESAG